MREEAIHVGPAFATLVGDSAQRVFAVVFGLLAFGWPGITLKTLLMLFGAYALADEISVIIKKIGGWGERKTAGCSCCRVFWASELGP